MSQIPICSICHEQYTPNCLINSTTCGHLFHLNCILQWFEISITCPECRRCSPGIFPAYLCFQRKIKMESLPSPNTEAEIEELIKTLSLTEEKHRNAAKELVDLKKKLKEQIDALQTLLNADR